MPTFVGTLAEPDLAPSVGQTIHTKSVLVPPDQSLPRTKLLDQDLFGALLFVESITPAGAHVHGTAFLVAPGIALTAWHTIKDWMDAGHFGEPDHAIFACGTIGNDVRVWEVRSCQGPAAGGDVALLILAPRFPLGDEVSIVHFALAVALPEPGSNVTVLGMRLEPPDAVLPLREGEHQLPAVSIVTIASVGSVEECYLAGIPRVRAPCFAAGAFSIGGMSGGPVFDKRGYVVGIVSESIVGAEPDDCVTFASLIWPALFFDFEGVWPQGMFPPDSTLQRDWVLDRWRIYATEAGEIAYLDGGSPDFIGPPNPLLP